MFEYHGWISTFDSLDPKEIKESLQKINRDYPVSVQYVNGNLHISFSGNPNRDCGELRGIIDHLKGLNAKLYGCVYINDANSKDYNHFEVIKFINDNVISSKDKNFSLEETKIIFE